MIQCKLKSMRYSSEREALFVSYKFLLAAKEPIIII